MSAVKIVLSNLGQDSRRVHSEPVALATSFCTRLAVLRDPFRWWPVTRLVGNYGNYGNYGDMML